MLFITLTRFLIVFVLPVSIASADIILATENDNIAYSIGYITGNHLQQQNPELNPEVFIAGFKDSFTKTPILAPKQITDAIDTLNKRQEMQQRSSTELAKTNLETGKAFLIKNKQDPKVKTLPSGLQYIVMNEGQGDSPSLKDKVKVHYLGTLLNGNEFDSSYKRGKPAVFQVKSLISGWQEALIKMKPNAKWKLFVPPHLAYGESGAEPAIGPNSTLIFEIELLEVNP